MISIIIPTVNGIETLADVFDAIAAQRIDHAVEVVAIDSGSTDGTLELLGERASTLIEIPREEFNHGTTRNLGIEASHGDLVVLLVQDAIPVSPDWLAKLIAPFESEATAGTFAHQLPRPDASAVTRMNLARWIAGEKQARTISVDDAQTFTAMAPMDQFLASVFDNVCSCLRRSVWREHPFRETAIGEDLEWGREVLLAGHSLVYAPNSEVIHSHERSASYELKRTYLVHKRLYELFGVRTISTLPLLFRSIASTLSEHRRVIIEGDTTVGEQGRAHALGVVWPLGQYLGGLAGARGWRLLRARGI